MAFVLRYILILQCLLIPAVLAENNNEQKKNYLYYFLDYMNNLPDQLYAYEDGILVNVQEIAPNVFNIESNVKVSEVQNPKKFKLLRCTGRIVDSKSSGLSMVRDSYYCQEDVIEPNVVTEVTNVPEADVTQDDYIQTTEALFIQQPVKLDNEVQPDNAATSGEQFIAIPRISPSPCIGCSSHVDVAAAGVQELATLAVRHLDRHEPNVKHTLKSVADVERQVQAVNGVRFILTLLIDYNNCSVEVNDNCQGEKACKISILEKPWLKLPDGSKFRAIMSNNCTDEWIFGDHGEVLPPVAENTEDNDLKSDSSVDNNHHDWDKKPTSDHGTTNIGSEDKLIKVHEIGLQSQIPSHERHLTDEELKILEDQIIPINQFNQLPDIIQIESSQQPIKSVEVNELPSSKKESENTYKEMKIENENKTTEPTQDSISYATEESTQSTISDDKKHAIDDLMKFFDIDIHSAGISKNTEGEQTNLRTKRNYNKIINATCEDIEDNEFEPGNNNSLLRRKLNANLNFVGGLQEQDPKNIKYVNLAKDALKIYQSFVGNGKVHDVIEINRVTTKIVAGILTEIDFKIGELCAVGTVECKDYTEKLDCNARIWDRSWLPDGREINVNCEDTNVKHKGTTKIERREVVFNNLTHDDANIAGGIVEDDPTLKKYLIMAKLSLQKLYQQSNEKHIHKVIAVDRVTNQVVAGQLTKIDFRITPTSCLLTNTLYIESNCKPKNPMAVIRCQSQFWHRPWLAEKKKVKITCDSGDTLTRGYDDVRFKRRVEKKNKNDREYKLLTKKALQKYELLTNPEYAHRIVRIDRVTTEVVDTILTKLYFAISPTICRLKNVVNVYSSNCPLQDPSIVITCIAEVWDVISEFYFMSDENQIQVVCKNAWESRQKRNVPLGGVTDQDPENGQYKLLAEESLQQYHQLPETEYVHKINKLEKVTTQVVQGMLTKIYFSILPTTCRIGNVSLSDISKCDIQSTSDINCISEVWERPWLPKPRDIVVKCNNKTSRDVEAVKEEESANSVDIDKEQHISAKRSVMVGGEQIQDVNKHEYTVLAEEALRKYESISSSEYSHMVSKIERVTTQVVAGQLTEIDFTVLETECARNKVSTLGIKNCDLKTPSIGKKCHAEIWDRPWMKSREIDVICKKSKAKKYKNTSTMKTGGRSKRQTSKDTEAVKEEPANYVGIDKQQHISAKRSVMVGGKQKQDGNKHEYTVLAEEALRKYESISSSEYSHMVSKIERVTTQVVGGQLTKIDFTVLETECARNKVSTLGIKNCDLKTPSVGKKCHAEIWDRPWMKSREIDVSCNKNKAKMFMETKRLSKRQAVGPHNEDNYIETHIEFEDADATMEMAKIALKHIEAKYPQPYKQKIVRVLSLEKQTVAGIHYRMKMEVGHANCPALTVRDDCNVTNEFGLNKFCRVNIWFRPWVNHGANYRVSCDYNEAMSAEINMHVQAEHLFGEFVKTYKPDYVDDWVEMAKRFEIFKDNVKKIHELNTHDKGTATYAVTRFADLTYEEFKSKYLGLRPGLRDLNQIPMPQAVIPNVDLPDNFDWRDKGAVTEVKNQGSCGSCWAFSVTGNIEGQWKLRKGQLLSLSEQELVDCDTLDQGCDGGLPDNAYRAIEQLGGLETESDYPYEGEDDKCEYNRTLSRVQISGAVNISSNETKMAKWLLKHGPISIGINANAMQFYVGGVSHPWKIMCNPENLDHGVLIVGYGIKDYPLFNKKMPYWIVKNSWGKTWGEQGYYRVFRGDGTCGVNTMASSAVI